MSQQIDNELIERLASDKSFQRWVLQPDDEGEGQWSEYLKDNPSSALSVEYAKDFVLSVHDYFDQESIPGETLRQEFNAIKQRDFKRGWRMFGSGKLPRLSLGHVAAIAASLALLLFINLWMNQSTKELLYSTGFGEWKEVVLPDDSRVTLNSNSQIRLADRWDSHEDRVVVLSGEAYFEVKKNQEHDQKFKVLSGDVTIEVLGTEFNVSARADHTDVFLDKGKIKVHAGSEDTYLDPGDYISYSAELQKITKRIRPEDSAPYKSWKDGTMVMLDKSTEEILSKFEEIYGVQFEVTRPEIAKLKTTLSIPMDRLEIALPVLERTLNVKIERNENKLLIK